MQQTEISIQDGQILLDPGNILTPTTSSPAPSHHLLKTHHCSTCSLQCIFSSKLQNFARTAMQAQNEHKFGAVVLWFFQHKKSIYISKNNCQLLDVVVVHLGVCVAVSKNRGLKCSVLANQCMHAFFLHHFFFTDDECWQHDSSQLAGVPLQAQQSIVWILMFNSD